MLKTSFHALLSDFIDLSVLLDEVKTDSGSRKYDREIGQRLKHLKSKPVSQIRAWLRIHQEQNQTAIKHSKGVQAGHSASLISMVVLIIGLLLGVLTASATLYYDGSHPINVVSVLAILVALPMLLLLLWWISALPQKITRFIPGMGVLSGLIANVNPGHLIGWAKRILPDDDIEFALPNLPLIARAMTLYWSQLAGVGFVTGAFVAVLLSGSFSDLAFGWSTTVKTESASVHALTSTLALPWHSWLPQAVPSLELIEISKYFRHAGGSLPNTEVSPGGTPELLGRWWPFVLMCILVYAVLPRWLSFAYATWMRRRVLGHAILAVPGAQQLLDRMNQPLVETGARIKEQTEHDDGSEARAAILPLNSGEECVLVNWAQLFPNAAAAREFLHREYRINATGSFDCGGRRTTREEESVVNAIAEGHSHLPIVLLVKAWEPPLLELIDFVSTLRQAMSDEKSVYVTLMDSQNTSLTPQVQQKYLNIWSDTLRSPEISNVQLTIFPTHPY